MSFEKCIYPCNKHPRIPVKVWNIFITLRSSLEKAMATYSSTLTWKIPWTEEPGGLQSMGSLGVRHNWATSLYFSLACIGEGNGNPLQCSCLENPRDRASWWAAVCGSHRVGHDWSDSAARSSFEHLFNLFLYSPQVTLFLFLAWCINFVCTKTWYKWDYMVYISLCLVSFIRDKVFEID